MFSVSNISTLFYLFLLINIPFYGKGQSMDWRNIDNGLNIPSVGYIDQPYIIQTNDSAWLCVITTGAGHEGSEGQHLVSYRTFDKGTTWVDKQEIEPPHGPEASYSVLLKDPRGRIYVFYNHNSDNLRYVLGDDPPFEGGRFLG